MMVIEGVGAVGRGELEEVFRAAKASFTKEAIGIPKTGSRACRACGNFSSLMNIISITKSRLRFTAAAEWK